MLSVETPSEISGSKPFLVINKEFTKNPSMNIQCSSESMKISYDVNGKLPKEETKSIEELISLEEESVEGQMVRATSVTPSLIEEPFSFRVVTISSSPGYKGSSGLSPGNAHYFNLLNLETVVLTSSCRGLVGQQRFILNHQQLSSLGCLATSCKSDEEVRFNTIFKSSEIPEEDVFWDNFWFFKQKQEETQAKANSDTEDSDEEILHKKPVKIGSILKDPRSLLEGILQKKFRKIRRKLMFINSVGGLSLMMALFLVQLRYSRRFRAHSKTLAHLLLFTLTLLGLGGSFFLIYSSMSDKKKTKNEADRAPKAW